MRIAPIPLIRPPKARAVEVACAPHAHQAGVHGLSGTNYVRVLGAGPDPAAMLAALQHLLLAGALEVDHHPRMFVYRAVHAGRRWMGLLCAVDTRDLGQLLADSTTPEEARAAEAERAVVGTQLDPALLRTSASDEAAFHYVSDMNERPAYHFVSHDESTHSAWTVHRPELYVHSYAQVRALEVLSGGAQLMAAHHAGVPALAILSADIEPGMHVGALAPRVGLFVGVPRER